MRTFCRVPVSPEVLGEALGGQIDDAVGGREDRLRRAIIAIERDNLDPWAELTGEATKKPVIRTVSEPGFHVGAGERDCSIRLRFDHLEPTVVGGLLQLDPSGKVNEAAVVATVNGALTPRRSKSRPQLIAKYQRPAPRRDACEARLADLMRAYTEGPS